MLQREELKDGWQDENVKEALDLCLSCKGCKSDCPVNVDMATYKAEFMSHYYEAHKRPLSAEAFGHIDRWAALASLAPNIANFFSQTPGLSDLMKAALVKMQQQSVQERRKLNDELQALREQHVQQQERRALAAEVAALRERLAGLEGRQAVGGAKGE